MVSGRSEARANVGSLMLITRLSTKNYLDSYYIFVSPGPQDLSFRAIIQIIMFNIGL